MSAFDASSAALSLLQLATVPPNARSASKCLSSVGDSIDPVVLSDDEDSLTSSSSKLDSLSSNLSSSSPLRVSPSSALKSITDTVSSTINEASHSSTAQVSNEFHLETSSILSNAPRLKCPALGMRRSLVPFNSKPFFTPRDGPVSTRPKRASAAAFSSVTAPKRLGIGHLSLVSPPFITSSANSKPDANTSNEGVIEECLSHEERIRRILSKPFQTPIVGNSAWSMGTMRPLGMRPMVSTRRPLYDPFAPNALVLYAPPELSPNKLLHADKNKLPVHVVVDPILSKCLRPHQREGVKFLYDSVTGIRIENHFGCIMADEMGLGKTLQCIALLWTLLLPIAVFECVKRQGPDCVPIVDKAIIVTPSSLVKNWQKEIEKWLAGRLPTLVVDSGDRETTEKELEEFVLQIGRKFLARPLLIISYESFRSHAAILHSGAAGLMICDEGHRLKNADNQTYEALNAMKVQRRVLLSGTPIQNDLLEYFSLVDFVNPSLLGTASEFRRKFENPILRSRDSSATAEVKEAGEGKLKELLLLVNRCVIRRTQQLLKEYLPVKFEYMVFCKLTQTQEAIYRYLVKKVESQIAKKKEAAVGEGIGMSSALRWITYLKKVCNHPDLLFVDADDDGRPGARGKPSAKIGKAFNQASVLALYPPDMRPSIGAQATYTSSSRGGGHSSFRPELSGKFMLLDTLLAIVRTTSNERFVLISNFTQTLDLCERLCQMRNYSFVRLDGSMTIKKRAKIVDEFNSPRSQIFVFMLSSKAGGCGLNLVGASRLVMLDPDWNPANDDQALARIWRDGQRRTCHLYRFFATDTIEEKVLQRQTHKKALSSCVIDEAVDTERHFSLDELRELFSLGPLDAASPSDTHNKLKCSRCADKIQLEAPAAGSDCQSDLSQWQHMHGSTPPNKRNEFLEDEVLKTAWDSNVISFLMFQRSHEAQRKTA